MTLHFRLYKADGKALFPRLKVIALGTKLEISYSLKTIVNEHMYTVYIFYDLIRLEGKKRQKKPEIKDPKLQELQERLEARKAGK